MWWACWLQFVARIFEGQRIYFELLQSRMAGEEGLAKHLLHSQWDSQYLDVRIISQNHGCLLFLFGYHVLERQKTVMQLRRNVFCMCFLFRNNPLSTKHQKVFFNFQKPSRHKNEDCNETSFMLIWLLFSKLSFPRKQKHPFFSYLIYFLAEMFFENLKTSFSCSTSKV